MIDKNIKKDLLKIKTGEDWNIFTKKYKNKINMIDWDDEMKKHFSSFLINLKEKEHYDYKKK